MVPRSKQRPTVVKLSGDVDVFLKGKLQTELQSLADGGVLVVDMREVKFIDSAGLTVLIDVHKRTSRTGGELRLIVQEEQQVYRILQITGLTRLLRLFASEESATAG